MGLVSDAGFNISISKSRNELGDNTTIDRIIEEFKSKWEVKEWTRHFFTEDHLTDINIHWLKFDAPKKSSFIILAVLYIIVMVLGLFGNYLVVFLFMRNKSLRTPANTLLVNLAVSDGLMMSKMPIFIYNSFNRGPALGDLACRLYGFIGGLSGTASIVTLAAISFDRYFVIAYPLSRKYADIRIKTSVIGSWIYATVFSSIQLFDIGLGKYQYEGYLVSCSFDYLTDNSAIKIFIIVFCVAAWVLPFHLITFSYIKILQVVVQKSFGSPTKKESFRHVREETRRKQEIKLALTILAMIFLWVFSWTPYSVISLLGISGNKQLITPISSMIPALFCKTASAIDPYVYAISHPKFREQILKLFSKKDTMKKRQKVWYSRSSKRTQVQSRDTSIDNVEEEFIDVEVHRSEQKRICSGKAMNEEELKRHECDFEPPNSSYMLCFKPSFSNRPSSLRKLSRRFSTFNTQKCSEEE
ncbi:opsin, ultraviolet-sensitive-like isoform X2 [Sitophilus oryzae]|nr:opsin, ultraviolet-sensitive-like isoform X2 [Sitophilus oryzae]